MGWPSQDPEDYRRRGRAPRPEHAPPGRLAVAAGGAWGVVVAFASDLRAMLGIDPPPGEVREPVALLPPELAGIWPPSKNPDDYR